MKPERGPQIISNRRGGLSKRVMEKLMEEAQRDLERNKRLLGSAAPSETASHKILVDRFFSPDPQGGEALPPQIQPRRHPEI